MSWHRQPSFCVTFFVFHASFFTFRTLQHFAPGSAFAQNSKDFVVYFFGALIKRKIRMKCEKCTVSASYFVVCFAKTFAKYARNTKYEKCIAGLRLATHLLQNTWKRSQNAKNEKRVARYFASLFSRFAQGSVFAQKAKEFCGLFFRNINKTRNSYEIRKVYSECFIFRVVFREMRNTKSALLALSVRWNTF